MPKSGHKNGRVAPEKSATPESGVPIKGNVRGIMKIIQKILLQKRIWSLDSYITYIDVEVSTEFS